MTHWACDYIGAPYALGASGENGYYDCWGLVRHVQQAIYARALPPISASNHSTRECIRLFTTDAERKQWRPVRIPEESDCVLLTQKEQPHHIGVWCDMDGGGILHAVVGAGVIYQDIAGLKRYGWKIEGFYRHVSQYGLR